MWRIKSRKTSLQEKQKIDRCLCADYIQIRTYNILDLSGDELRTIFEHPGYAASRLEDMQIKSLIVKSRHRFNQQAVHRVFNKLQGLEKIIVREFVREFDIQG